jgi:hypothetical protein
MAPDIDCVPSKLSNRASTEQEGQTMKNPLDSLWGTIITGVILTAILYYVVKNVLN